MDKSDSSRMQQPYKVLKQMSIRRQDLERSSLKLASDLEELQQINEEQDERISNTLSALQQEQRETQKILQQSNWPIVSDVPTEQIKHEKMQQSPAGNSLTRKKVQREPSVLRKLRHWSTSDVIQWLENRKLHKFILLFQRHHVTGSDLADTNLFFLESYDHISTVDRELLLAEVYNLLSLEVADDDDLKRITTPVEKEKYKAACQITKDVEQKYCRSQSLPVVYLPSHSSPSSSSPSSAASSPTPKLRKKSEPSPESHRVLGRLVQRPGLLDMETNKSDSLGLLNTSSRKCPAEKLKPKCAKSVYGKSLFAALKGQSHPPVTCCVLYKENGQFGLSIEMRHNGQLLVKNVDPSLQIPVNTGDRILEINGHSCLSDKKIQKFSVDDVIRCSESLQLVVYREMDRSKNSKENSSHDLRWHRLRNFLEGMKDQDVDVTDMMKNVSPEEMTGIRQQASLQDTLYEARSQINEQQILIDKLQKEMTLQNSDLEEMTRQRDTAVKATTNSKIHKSACAKHGETEYYRLTMESLNVESLSKEKVIESLKEIVKEASKQKFYLDRLISVVIEEVPWILEQVDADFDNSSFSTQSEEFC